jgi:hypothetical protein
MMIGMTAEEYHAKVIAMLTVALETDPDEYVDGPLWPVFAAPFSFPWPKPMSIEAQAELTEFVEAYNDHLAKVFGYIIGVLSGMMRAAEEACPGFDPREVLREYAIQAAMESGGDD